MREILFRAKRVVDNEWVEGYFDNNYLVPIISTRWDNDEIYRETLGQFTGLYDKNSVKIFEGDIVKARMTDKYTVVFNRGSFMGEYTSPYGRYTVRVDLLKDDWEVIGNIYDNPELLEESK